METTKYNVHNCHEKESLSSSLVDQFLNFDYEDDLFEKAINSPKALCLTDKVVCSSDDPAIVTSQATDTTTNLPCFDISFDDPNLISIILSSPPPPEPDILPTPSSLSMAPIHPIDQMIHPMISNPTFTSYQPNSLSSQLSLDPLGLPGYLGIEPSVMGMPTCGAEDEMGIYASAGMPVRPPEAAKVRGLGAIYTYGAMSRVYSPRNLQVLGDNQHIMARSSTSSTPLQVPFKIPTTDDSNYKGCRISVEERKEKIDKYLRKRKVRNFSKTIKYACRKAIADKRPRVRGRFAKNDEFNEVLSGPTSADGGHHYEKVSTQGRRWP